MIQLSLDLKVLLVAIVVGLLTFKKSDPLYLKLLPFFLLFTLLVELTGELFHKPGLNNAILFNLYSVVEFVFYTYFFKMVAPGKKVKHILTSIMWILPVVCLVNIFLIQGINVFHTLTYAIGCLTMVALGIVYFIRLFNSLERVELLKTPAFWISVGIIFFFTSAVSVLGVANYIATLPKELSSLLQRIFFWVNAFFYIMFIIAFLCRRSFRKL
jgi:hypothetical protein